MVSNFLQYPLTSVLGVGVFDLTDTDIRISVFLGSFDCRWLNMSYIRATPQTSLFSGATRYILDINRWDTAFSYRRNQ